MRRLQTLSAGLIPALVLLSGGLPPEATAQTVTRGPYLQTLTPDSVVIRWRTDEATSSLVRYGTDQDGLSLTAGSSTLTEEHEVSLSRLASDTRYFYSIGTSSEVLAGGDASHAFVTAPEPGTAKPTRVWVIGDSGTADTNAAAVRDAYKAIAGGRQTDVWLMLGDNAYQDGTDDEYQRAVFDMYPELLRQVALWPTLGNHDGHSADSGSQSGPYYDMFTLPTAGEAGGLPSGTEAYYSFDYGNIHFVCLDSYETDRSPDGPMLTWLENDLAANDKEWLIAFWHHPPYSKGSHDSDSESQLIDMRENVLPILEDYGVDLVLSGHSHSYERSFLLDGHYGKSSTLTSGMTLDGGSGREDGDGSYVKPFDGTTPHEGAVYTVAGSSGKVSSEGSLDHPAMFIGLRSLGSVVLEVHGQRLDAAFIDGGGTVRDWFTIEHGPIDTTAPALLRAEALDETTVAVDFSEALDQATAEDAGNFKIDNGVSVLSAALQADDRTIQLTTSSLIEGIEHTLTVTDVQDRNGNPMAASQVQFTYVTVMTMHFQDGVAPTSSYAGTRETTLVEAEPETNLGAATTLFVDGDDPGGTGKDLSALIAWDLSAIPAGAVAESATITVDVKNKSGNAYELYEVVRDWNEDEATWAEAATGTPWAGAGATGSADREAIVLGRLTATTLGAHSVPLNDAGLAVVQAWIDGARPNHGLIISDSAATNGLDFAARETDAATSRPKLTVIYNLPPNGGDFDWPSAPSDLRVMGTTDTEVTLAWSAASDDVGVEGYKVYRDDAMTDTTVATTFTDTGLVPDTRYAYQVTAFDAAGNESDGSNKVWAITDPAADGGELDRPIDLTGSPGEEETVTINVAKPAGATDATLSMQVFDADNPDEGELYINGNGPITLFGSKIQANDNVVASVTFDTPAAWWVDGSNSLRFVHTRTQGYRIDSLTVTFSGEPPDPGKTPPTATLAASPTSIAEGETSTLTWSSTDAAFCDGTNFETAGATSGSVIVSPASDSTYTVTCSNMAGSASDSVAVTVTPSSGAVFYVDGNHSAASDSNPGTESSPWKTIQKAADTLSPGDTVYIKQGTYSPFTVKKSGSAAGGYITFAAAPGHERLAIVDGTGSTSNAGNCIYSRGKSYIAIRDLEVRSCGKAGIWIEGSSAGSTGIRISGNFIHHTESMAVAAVGKIFTDMLPEGEVRLTDVIIEGNEITKTNEPSGRNEGISAGNGLRDFIIRNNHLYDSQQYGIDCKIGCSDGEIYGNHIHGFEKHAIYLDSRNEDISVYNNRLHNNRNGIVLAREELGAMRDIRIYNNALYNNERYGILVYRHADDPTGGVFDRIEIVNNTAAWNGSSGISMDDDLRSTLTNTLVRNNILWGNGFDNGAGVPADSNLIGVSPEFVSESKPDLRLKSGSPAIDAGSSDRAPAEDFDAVSRPQGGGFDIGAFEFNP